MNALRLDSLQICVHNKHLSAKHRCRRAKASHRQQARRAGIALPTGLPKQWIVHCTRVGHGLPALQYLSRYLDRGVIQGPGKAPRRL